MPGDYDLNISCTAVPANDNCDSAPVITDGVPAAQADNSQPTETDDGVASCEVSQADAWFKYVATCDGEATVDTFGSGQEDTVLSVYDACDGTEIACNDDTGGLHAEVSFDATPGQSYWVRVASFGVPGDYDLNIKCRIPGDMNCDMVVDINDVPLFVQALVAPFEYMAAFPDCDIWLADMNKDGNIDGLDITDFIAAVLAP